MLTARTPKPTAQGWFLMGNNGPAEREYFLCFPNPNRPGMITKTSPIMHCENGIVTTLSGSRYPLGTPDFFIGKQYEQLGLEFDPEDPIPSELWRHLFRPYTDAKP